VYPSKRRLKDIMDIADLRKKIDEIDQRLVELLSERARAAHEIGRLKRKARLPIYEPDREQTVFNHVTKVNAGPLPNRDLMRIYERIMDIMRQIQQEEIAPETIATEPASGAAADTEIDSEVND
jgi:chorismate mutase